MLANAPESLTRSHRLLRLAPGRRPAGRDGCQKTASGENSWRRAALSRRPGDWRATDPSQSLLMSNGKKRKVREDVADSSTLCPGVFLTSRDGKSTIIVYSTLCHDSQAAADVPVSSTAMYRCPACSKLNAFVGKLNEGNRHFWQHQRIAAY